MEVIRITHSKNQFQYMMESHVMALGFFDGVHLGHQILLEQTKKIAKMKRLTFAAMTFDPHPDEVIKCEKDRRYLTPLPIKIEKMASLGVERLFIVSFNKSFASLTPIDFIKQYVLGLCAKHIVVGYDFSFGYKAQGDVDYLRNASNNNPFDVTVISKKTNNNKKIGSTLIRSLIKDGDVHLVPYYLGQHYEIKGRLRFSNLQKLEGIPNMEIDIGYKYFLPAPGSYQVVIKKGNKTFQGLFRRYDSNGDRYEISYFDMRCLKEEDIGEFTVTFLNQIPSINHSKVEYNSQLHQLQYLL